MTRTRGPGNLVARRPTTEARVDVSAHQSYAAMIDAELGGRRQGSYRAIDEGRPPSTLALMMRPLALFLFACTGFVIVALLWLWQAGVFERFRPEARPVPVVSTTWMGARRAAPVTAHDNIATPTEAPAASQPAVVPAEGPTATDAPHEADEAEPEPAEQ